jgi:hypothetical protein
MPVSTELFSRGGERKRDRFLFVGRLNKAILADGTVLTDGQQGAAKY